MTLRVWSYQKIDKLSLTEKDIDLENTDDRVIDQEKVWFGEILRAKWERTSFYFYMTIVYVHKVLGISSKSKHLHTKLFKNLYGYWLNKIHEQ